MDKLYPAGTSTRIRTSREIGRGTKKNIWRHLRREIKSLSLIIIVTWGKSRYRKEWLAEKNIYAAMRGVREFVKKKASISKRLSSEI